MDPLGIHAQSSPDKPAVIEGDDVMSYAAFNAEINRFGSGLQALGLRVGERAVFCGPNARQVLTTVHAGRKTGLVTVPLAYRFTPDEMAYVVDNSDAALVVIDAEQQAKIEQVRDQLPNVREVVVYGGDPLPGFRAWDDVLALGADEEPSFESTDGFGATMIYTSGTTGKPKGALRTSTDPSLVLSLLQIMRWQPPDEVHLTTGPLYHSGPLAWAQMTHSVGGTVVLLRRFDAEQWIDLVREHRVTNTFSAPTQLKRIVNLPADVLARADLSSMRSLVANAAPVPYSLKQEIVEKLGDWFLFEVYGSTELGVDTVMEPEDQLRKPGSCGKTYGTVQVKVVDEAGNELPPGEAGELYVRSTLALDGYHRTDEKVSERAGWKSVGDVARIDEEGFVSICDRVKDMIISGGMNIYPAEIESVLHSHPDVMDVAVFGVPDEEWGEKVHAVIQPKAGRMIDLAALEAFASDRLASYKRPRSWEFREELPRTESGKLLKRSLRDEHWAGRDSRV